MRLRALVLGAGGREHALAWALAQGGHEVVCAPGNGGTATLGRNLPLDVTDAAAVVRCAREVGATLVVIGPDAAVAAGVADACSAEEIPVFGPTAAAGRIEWSKRFAKEVMRRAGVPTARSVIVDASRRDEAAEFIREHAGNVAVKADGLALGKGVSVHSDIELATLALDACLRERRFGAAGDVVIIEERLSGPEVSVFALCDGEHVRLLTAACDYKRAFDGDSGPNTGGMGAYAPPVHLDVEEVLDSAMRWAIQPAVDALRDMDTPYHGCLYAGLMLTEDGMRVLEYNARFGDPETQAVLPLLAEDTGELLWGCVTGQLPPGRAEAHPGAAVAVVAASQLYPDPSPTGYEITGLDGLDADVLCFHAGTERSADGTVRTSGGRVLAVAARGSGLADAQQRVYANLARVSFQGMRYRRDIAATAGVPT